MKHKRTAACMLAVLMELLSGVLLLINPEGFTRAIIQLLGLCMTVIGLWTAIGYFRKPVKEVMADQRLSKGLAALALGLFGLFNAGWFLSAFPVLATLYGVLMLVGGFVKMQASADLFRLGQRKWYVAAVSAALSVIGAAVILCDPFTSIAALWIFTGVMLMVQAAADTTAAILNGRDRKPAKNKDAASEA